MYYARRVRIAGIAEPWPTERLLAKLDSKHAVTPDEVEEALFDDAARWVTSGAQGTNYVFSRTDAGRYLFVVVRALEKGLVKVVTARDMDPAERSRYTKHRKGG